jgi:hypothetical protein
MITPDTLVCSLQISTNQFVREARQFEAAVASPTHRAEIAELLEDTIVALAQVGQRLDP